MGDKENIKNNISTKSLHLIPETVKKDKRRTSKKLLDSITQYHDYINQEDLLFVVIKT